MSHQIKMQFSVDPVVHANVEHITDQYKERGVPKAAVLSRLLMLGIQVTRDLDIDLADELQVARTQMETLTIDWENDNKSDMIDGARAETIRQARLSVSKDGASW